MLRVPLGAAARLAATFAAALVVVAAVAAPRRAHAQRSCDHAARPSRQQVAVGAGFVGANALLLEHFRREWWSGERTRFHVHNDWHMPFRNQDKLGHALGGYTLTRAGAALLRAACVSPRKAAWWGAAYSTLLQLEIELADGVHASHGFSPPDVAFNAVGTAYAVAQAGVPALRHAKPTFSYAPTRALKRAPTGSQLVPTLDYAGQTYWIAVDVEELLPSGARERWPGIIRASVGRSVTDWMDPETGELVAAKSRLVLSLDLDPSRLPGDHPTWRAVKRQLSYYRFPAPAIVLTPSLKAVAWYR